MTTTQHGATDADQAELNAILASYAEAPALTAPRASSKHVTPQIFTWRFNALARSR